MRKYIKKAPKDKIRVTPTVTKKGSTYYVVLRINLGKSAGVEHLTKRKVEGKKIYSVSEKVVKYRSITLSTGLSFQQGKDWNKVNRCFTEQREADNLLLQSYILLTEQLIQKYYSLVEKGDYNLISALLKKLVFHKDDNSTYNYLITDKGELVNKQENPQYIKHPVLSERNKNQPQIKGDVEQVAEFVVERLPSENTKQKVLNYPLYMLIEKIYKDWQVTGEKAYNTARTYKNSATFIKRYGEDLGGKKIRVQEFNQKFIEEFILWAKRQKKEDGEYYAINYISEIRKQLQVIDSVLKSKYNFNSGIVWEKNKILEKKKESSIDIALNTEKVKQLLNYTVPEYYIDKKKIKRKTPTGKYWALDLIKVGLFTGLRASDLLNLNLVESNGNVYVKQTLQKTGVQVNFVVPELIKEIWLKYNRKLPKLTPQKLGDYFQEIGLELNWTEFYSYTRKNPVSGQKVLIKEKEFFRMLKTSTLRRTWATLAINHFKLNPLEVCKVTGHTNIKQLMEYVRVDEQELNNKLSAKFSDFGV